MDKIFLKLTRRTDEGNSVTMLINEERILHMERNFVKDGYNDTEIGTFIYTTQGSIINVEEFLCSIETAIKDIVTIRKV